jgi:hypothetical protein
MFQSEARRIEVDNGERFANMVYYKIEIMLNGGLNENFIEHGKQLDVVSKRLREILLP